MPVQLTERLVLVLVLLAPWTLLWLDAGLLFPYTTGKVWLFRSIVELAFTLSLLTLLGRNLQYHGGGYTWQPAGKVYVGILIAFLLWSAISNLSGIDPYRSFWSNWERMSGYLDYLHWGLYLFCLLTIITHERSRWLMFNLILVITAVSALGLLDDSRRIISTLGNPIYLGNLAVFGLFIGIYFLSGLPRNGWSAWLGRAVVIVAVSIMLLALYRSAARGPLIALFIGFSAMLLTLGYLSRRPVYGVASGLLLLVVTLLLTLGLGGSDRIAQTLQASDSYFMQRLGDTSLQDQTTADRLENWSIALSAAGDHPWLGWGQDNYTIAFNEHYRSGMIDKARIWFDRAHNAYLDALVAGGIPGLLLYMTALLMPFYLLARSSGMSMLEQAALTGFVIAFLVKNLVGFDTFSSTLIWMTCLAVILVGHRREAPLIERQYASSASFPWLVLSLGLLTVTFTIIYSLNIRHYQDNQRFAELMKRPLAGKAARLDIVLDMPVESMRYARTEKMAVFDNILRSDALKLSTTKKEQVFHKAIKLLEEGIQTQPRDYRIRYNGALLLAHAGHLEAAIEQLEELARQLPQRAVIWHTLSSLYSETGRPNSAEYARRTATELNPDWNP